MSKHAAIESDELAAQRTSLAADAVERLTRWRDDFPTPGVRFADLTPVFADAEGFRTVIDCLAHIAPDADLVAGVDARGFLIGAGVAASLGTGVIAVRKAGKLPPPVLEREYELEYGTAALEIPADGVPLAGRRVLLLDDVLATGGTLAAAADLFRQAGAEIVAAAVVLELTFLNGRERQGDYPVTSIVQV
ncbi:MULTISPECIES: adenine phosphoribosyltransferase [Nocardia]|uniref:Adenine phosphoribosyltransferase n=2 Tax=Nocardia TaxID=1817 RepID=K0F894_NOCB7|nr:MULTISPECIES: adenine phosphoribosyltransferase [Nocardia]AFU03706.1 adenine phosphoribosyltransferase [Nocardia brasiliensis ATCC 700358]ASF12685.1 adenine phosphoribosyltransferase [Nocardia brasiliensis]KIA59733.1 adenine phosphoribosyltransferase [Nocardia vulneris]MBF6131059.1 adenine phosphoribosyltransferase [Nocardia brasiliensis]MBF6542635.1 adenine phosphoribosyltransferase [Nocardia brasiliensis]